MDDKKAEQSNEQPEGTVSTDSGSNDEKARNTVPTLYPDIEYVNRTLP